MRLAVWCDLCDAACKPVTTACSHIFFTFIVLLFRSFYSDSCSRCNVLSNSWDGVRRNRTAIIMKTYCPSVPVNRNHREGFNWPQMAFPWCSPVRISTAQAFTGSICCSHLRGPQRPQSPTLQREGVRILSRAPALSCFQNRFRGDPRRRPIRPPRPHAAPLLK